MAAERDETVGSVAAPMGYYRHPDHPGETVHECGYTLHEHGWIDSYYVGGEDGITVCPAVSGPFQGQTVSERGRQPRRYDTLDDLRADIDFDGTPAVPLTMTVRDLVAVIHPDWPEEQVAEEARRIVEER